MHIGITRLLISFSPGTYASITTDYHRYTFAVAAPQSKKYLCLINDQCLVKSATICMDKRVVIHVEFCAAELLHSNPRLDAHVARSMVLKGGGGCWFI